MLKPNFVYQATHEKKFVLPSCKKPLLLVSIFYYECRLENLASKAALKVQLYPETVNEYRAGEAFECVSGNYTFAYEVEGKARSFASRFTFVINAIKDHPIIHHHSSQIPPPH